MRSLWIVVSTLALPCAAGELCVAPDSWYAPCPPDDLAFGVPSTGFDTDSEPCRTDNADAWFGVLVSSSATDPHANSGPLGDGNRLYLWMLDWPLAAAAAGYGWGDVWLEIRGDLDIVGYEPLTPADQDWRPQARVLTFGNCEIDEVPPGLLGAFEIRPTSVEAVSWGRVKAAYRE